MKINQEKNSFTCYECRTLKGMESDPHVQNLLKPRFLNCPAIFKVEHLKKFILNKFNINVNKFNVEISYKVKTIVLPEHYTLMDVAYIYTWKKVIIFVQKKIIHCNLLYDFSFLLSFAYTGSTNAFFLSNNC